MTAARADSPGALAGPTRLMMAGTTLSRLTGYGRVLALGYALGFNRLGDAYNLANTTPNIVYDLVLGGILSGTLVPVFVNALRADDEDWEGVSAVFSVTAVVLMGLTAVVLVAVPGLIRLYTAGLHDPSTVAERRLAVDLLYLFVPQLFLYGVVSLMTALLNARRRFAAPVFAPVLNNVVAIGALLAVPHLVHHVGPDTVRHSKKALLVLGVGTTAGVAVMAAAMVPALRTTNARLRWCWQPSHPAVRTVLRLSGWTAGFVAANQVALFIVTLLANRHAGDFSAYASAYIFFLLPHGIVAVSVMSALEPEVAHHWSEADVAACQRDVTSAIRLAASLIIPAALGYAVLARPVVRLLLQHGALTAHSARTTADVLALMALGLPTFSLYLLLMRAYQAMQDTRTMFLTYLVENGLNVAFALALYPAFGVLGLAAALSLAYLGGALLALWDLGRRLGGLGGARLGVIMYRVAVAAILTADVALGTSVLLAHALGTRGGAPLAARVLISVGAGVTVYIYLARSFGIHEVGSVLHLRRRPAS
jgi:putative peptidoglycan lipid II flippase